MLRRIERRRSVRRAMHVHVGWYGMGTDNEHLRFWKYKLHLLATKRAWDRVRGDENR